MKDGTTHLAYKPEHAVDLDTGAVIAAELYPADQGDTTTLPTTLTSAEAKLAAVGAAPTADEPAELVTDKGYFGREVLKSLADGAWTTRIAIGVDASTMEANAALRSIVRRDSGESYRQMLQRMAADSGIETAANDLAQMDRRRKGKKLSNADWVSTRRPKSPG